MAPPLPKRRMPLRSISMTTRDMDHEPPSSRRLNLTRLLLSDKFLKWAMPGQVRAFLTRTFPRLILKTLFNTAWLLLLPLSSTNSKIEDRWLTAIISTHRSAVVARSDIACLPAAGPKLILTSPPSGKISLVRVKPDLYPPKPTSLDIRISPTPNRTVQLPVVLAPTPLAQDPSLALHHPVEASPCLLEWPNFLNQVPATRKRTSNHNHLCNHNLRLKVTSPKNKNRYSTFIETQRRNLFLREV